MCIYVGQFIRAPPLQHLTDMLLSFTRRRSQASSMGSEKFFSAARCKMVRWSCSIGPPS